MPALEAFLQVQTTDMDIASACMKNEVCVKLPLQLHWGFFMPTRGQPLRLDRSVEAQFLSDFSPFLGSVASSVSFFLNMSFSVVYL